MTELSFAVALVRWVDEHESLQFVRRRVFIEEQHVPEAEEWDAIDALCLHALARDTARLKPLGTARLLPDGHIGRVAVLKEHRGLGIGAALMRAMIDAGRAQGHTTLKLSAQAHALAFYERFGFVAHGEIFLDAGIPHRAMTLAV